MSRIGRNPITVPSSVTVAVADGVVTVKGPNGTMTPHPARRHHAAPRGRRLTRRSAATTRRRTARCTD